MKKLVALVVIMLLPLGVFAQEVKIAFVNTQEILMAMPELTAMNKQLEDLNLEFENELKSMNEEYTNKYQAFVQQQDSLTENIRLRRMQEIQDLQQRMEQLYQVAQQTVAQKQEELFKPVQEKMMKAINDVGTENKYTYIVNAGTLLYTGDTSIDATPLVKRKLGI
ncbi:OmpH family outer membrane protein [Parabacteroides sp. PF5-6]|uniref:OmpH family outer membrane protein n=1 Tax=Parabacteroides sp. PF5-6 TaxID=1742403 RepID=UPI00240596A8|nr:OmpH family outer membrane protein [Parabacteroides sp. PF5-6]MDF9829359.1 outer membrane protein [Parabacteroides sp. PF5-6]